MKAWLMDIYRAKNSIVIWIKTKSKNIRLEKTYRSYIYLKANKLSEKLLSKYDIASELCSRQTYLKQWVKVYKIEIQDLYRFESIVRQIEKATRYRLLMYDADVAPEQMYLYENNLIPCGSVEYSKGKIMPIEDTSMVVLKQVRIKIVVAGDIRDDVEKEVKSIEFNGEEINGNEKNLLTKFSKKFIKFDPDVILMDYAFSFLPYLVKRLDKYSIKCPFHRWDDKPIIYKGGKAFYSYGDVYYRDFAIRLQGRFILDTTSTILGECHLESLLELCQLSGARLQHIASRSFGAVFQFGLVRELVKQGYLVPYKEKPVDKPLNLLQLLKADRVGHTLDPQIGFHKDVAEIDFCSMYPWIIYNKNISAETILSKQGPFEQVPGVPVKISLKYKGIVPTVIKPFLDRRMEYKRNPTSINKVKAAGLKWVLVTSFGYLRYREFKLGIPSSHMAIGAYAREILLDAMKLAEESGFEVIHGIIDSLYIKKKNITHEEVKSFCKRLERVSGIPISFDGVFKWVVFLPSILDLERPVPARYYGVYKAGGMKVRGIELRQRNVPKLVKSFQKKVLVGMSELNSRKEMICKLPDFCKMMKEVISGIKKVDVEWLICKVKVTKTEYKNNIPQRKLIMKLRKKGIAIMPGQTINYVYQRRSVVLVEDFKGKPDIKEYTRLLVRSLFILLQPFGVTKEYILELITVERQTKILEFVYHQVTHVYIPIPKGYKSRKGLSERYVRTRMEKNGWLVWRGGLINVLRRDEIYPNVRRKYEKLELLLDEYCPGQSGLLKYISVVHHGMPDFLCFRNGVFKFVECKLGHEQLSKVQKKTIVKLQEMGFKVEVAKLAEICTKVVRAKVDVVTGKRRVLEKQAMIRKQY